MTTVFVLSFIKSEHTHLVRSLSSVLCILNTVFGLYKRTLGSKSDSALQRVSIGQAKNKSTYGLNVLYWWKVGLGNKMRDCDRQLERAPHHTRRGERPDIHTHTLAPSSWDAGLLTYSTGIGRPGKHHTYDTFSIHKLAVHSSLVPPT